MNHVVAKNKPWELRKDLNKYGKKKSLVLRRGLCSAPLSHCYSVSEGSKSMDPIQVENRELRIGPKRPKDEIEG